MIWGRKNRKRKPARASRPKAKAKAKAKARPAKTDSRPAARSRRRTRPVVPARPWDLQQTLMLLALVAVCAGVFMSFPDLRNLWETDEARYAEIPREMLVLGDYVTPRLNYVTYFEKPPLTYWLVAVSYGLFGVSGWAARLVPGACGVAVAVLVMLLGRAMHGARAGFLAGLSLATMVMFFGLARVLMTDMVLCLGVVLAMYGAWISREGSRAGPYLFWLGCAAGFLSKGLLGPGLPIMAVVLFAVAGAEWGLLRRLAHWRGLLVFAALTLPWLVMVSYHNPGFLQYFFIDEHLGRLLTTRHQRYQPFWFYLALLPAAAFPWIALLPWAAWLSWPGRAWRNLDRRAWLYSAIWFLSFFLFFSVSSSKMMHYLLPALPPLALIMGRELDRAGSKGWRQWAPPALRAGLTGTALLCLAAGACIPLIPALHPLISFPTAGNALWMAPLAGAALAGAVFWVRQRLWAALAAPLAVFVLLATGAGVAAPRLEPWRSVEALTTLAAQEMKPQDLWVNYGDYFQGSPFYTRRRVAVVQNWGELDYGRRQAGDPHRWFIPDDRTFIKLLQDPRRRVVGLAETTALERLNRKVQGTPGLLLFEWARVGDKSLFSNRPR